MAPRTIAGKAASMSNHPPSRKRSPKQIRLFVTDYNQIAVDNALKMFNNEPELKGFTISKVELTPNHKLARMIRFTITRAPLEEYGNIIPVLID